MTERVHTTIRFDGPALEDHSMDVEHLAPALLSLGEVVKAANSFANGDRAGIKVFVNANVEQKCFELNIELVVTIWEQAKLLVTDDRVVTAKEIAEWIGLIGGTGYGLFRLIKFIKGRKIESVTILRLEDGRNVVEIRVEGKIDPIQVSKAVYELYANTTVRKKANDVLSPLREEGYETLEFYEGDVVFTEFSKADLPNQDGSDLPEVIPQNLHTSKIRTSVKIRKATYEGSSRWTLVYKKAIEAPIEDKSWLEQFQDHKVNAPPGSFLDVELEESYVTNDGGEIIGEPAYRVLQVFGVKAREQQRMLDFRDDNAS